MARVAQRRVRSSDFWCLEAGIGASARWLLFLILDFVVLAIASLAPGRMTGGITILSQAETTAIILASSRCP